MKKAVIAAVVIAALFAVWVYLRGSAPPQVAFARAQRETLVSTLNTNGRAEPVEWAAVRAEITGLVEQVAVERGQAVVKGAAIARIGTAEAQSAISSAEARVAQARAELEVIEAGGRAAEQTAVESSLRQARLEQQIAQREYESLRRLQAANAATAAEVNAARDRLEQANQQIAALEQKQKTLVGQADRAIAQARLRDAEAALQAARQRAALGVIRAPMSGIVYNLPIREGTYVNPGDLLAEIGRLDRMRVTVYVDEPELGRASTGMPVVITWDARPGMEWHGEVESVPTQVVALGTRQVGEVLCVVDNPNRELLPGTNVNAEIRTEQVEAALTIPREAVRREGTQTGVFVLEGKVIRWKPIRTGASSVTRVQVLEALSEGDSVALPTERPLEDGMEVTPVFRQGGQAAQLTPDLSSPELRRDSAPA